jgi:hypothetical protein
MTLPIF